MHNYNAKAKLDRWMGGMMNMLSSSHFFFFLPLVIKSQQKHKTEANNLDDKVRQSADLSVKPGCSG